MQFPNELANEVIFERRSDQVENAGFFGAFKKGTALEFILKTPRAFGASSPEIEIYRDDDGEILRFGFEWKESDFITDEYRLTIDLDGICSCDDGGLFYYNVSFLTGYGKMRVSYDPYSYSGKVRWYDDPFLSYQLIVYSGINPPEWLKGGIIYQIFVDRFNKGGTVPKKDYAIINDDWYNGIPQFAEKPGDKLENNMFFGGTLYGVAEKLDYIASLGVNCIYLNPIFEAYSNHKYDTADYSRVDSMFGGEKALSELIREAEKRNIRIILDGVFNHTGSDSIYFNKNKRYDGMGAYNSKESPYYEWYDFEEYPDKYRSWWGVDILPAVNSSCESFGKMINGEDGIIRKYIRMGTKGWRLDVADELSEDFLKDLYKAAKEEDPDSLVLGEVWEDASNKYSYGKRRHYFRGELDSVMNYPVRNGIIDYILYGDEKRLFSTMMDIYSHYPKEVSDSLMNILSTHDTERILTVLSGRNISKMSSREQSVMKLSENERKIASERLKIAFVLSATLPGVPCIYYGDEAGMEGGKDPFNRRPYPWGLEDNGILDFYRKICNIRRSEKLFKDGLFILTEGCPHGVFSFKRKGKNEEITVISNLSSSDYKAEICGIDLLTSEYSDEHIIKNGEFVIIKSDFK